MRPLIFHTAVTGTPAKTKKEPIQKAAYVLNCPLPERALVFSSMAQVARHVASCDGDSFGTALVAEALRQPKHVASQRISEYARRGWILRVDAPQSKVQAVNTQRVNATRMPFDRIEAHIREHGTVTVDGMVALFRVPRKTAQNKLSKLVHEKQLVRIAPLTYALPNRACARAV